MHWRGNDKTTSKELRIFAGDGHRSLVIDFTPVCLFHVPVTAVGMRKHLGLVPAKLLLVLDQGTSELLDSLWCHLVASDGPILYIMSRSPFEQYINVCYALCLRLFLTRWQRNVRAILFY